MYVKVNTDADSFFPVVSINIDSFSYSREYRKISDRGRAQFVDYLVETCLPKKKHEMLSTMHLASWLCYHQCTSVWTRVLFKNDFDFENKGDSHWACESALKFLVSFFCVKDC